MWLWIYQVCNLIEEFVEKEMNVFDGGQPAEVLLGRDMRPSGGTLLEAAKQGINSITGAVVHDMGILTIQQLHWMVRARNKGLKESELDYFEQLSNSFRCLINLTSDRSHSTGTDDLLVVDAANGVGGVKLEALKSMLNGLGIEICNSGRGGGVLNEGVDADYVQKEKLVPERFGSNDAGKRCGSLDGDADRLVYFMVMPTDGKMIVLVEGDKILSLYALFIKEQLVALIVEGDQARLGAVQTAYANRASTNYLKNLGIDVVFTPTGVKYLHERAAEYDTGIYFEANGHGTMLFSDSFLGWLETQNREFSSTCPGYFRHQPRSGDPPKML